ncbi:MAG: hypothetical protein V4710_04000, partial [Verrucomicrobiota bacterium]
MLDIRLIRDNPEFVKDRLSTRGGDSHTRIDEILECDRSRRTAETRLQHLQGERKRISKEIGGRKARGEETTEVEAQVRGIGDDISRLNEESVRLDPDTVLSPTSWEPALRAVGAGLHAVDEVLAGRAD